MGTTQGSDWAQSFADEQCVTGSMSGSSTRNFPMGDGRLEHRGQLRPECNFDTAWAGARADSATEHRQHRQHRQHVHGSQPPLGQADWARQFQELGIDSLDGEKIDTPPLPLRGPEGISFPT